MGESTRYVGTYVPIHDVREKLTGKVKYVGDMVLPEMLHARLLLSNIAHGRIKSIDTSKAEALLGVKAVYTYKNSSDNLYNSHKWISGLEVVKDERLFTDKVRYYGDRVAAVVAADRHTAEKAVRLIEVEYEELPVIIDPEEALKDDAVRIHECENVIFRKEFGCGDTEKGMENAYLVVRDRIETPKVHHGAMETHACIADTDPCGNITVWSPCQVIFQVQLIVAEALGIPESQVRVIKTTLGGSFGGKSLPTVEPVCAFLSYQLKKPVKLIMDRAETIIGTRTRNKIIGTVKTAVDKEGYILARDIHVLVDGGAYFTNGSAVAMAMGKKAFKLYSIKNQKYSAVSVYTNTPVGGACRGYGSPQIHAVTEINIDNAARKLGMDPVELRLKNLVKPYDKDLIGGPDLGNARVIDCVEKGAEAFEWKERFTRKKGEGRFVRGVGMACCAHGNGYYGAYPDFITMALRISGDGIAVLKGALHDLGCGTNTATRQIVADTLNMDIEKVYIPEADTLVSPFDSAGTQASRVTYVCGGAAMKVAQLVKEKITRYSADYFECNIEDVVMEKGFIWNKRKESVKLSYGDIAAIIQAKYSDEAGETVTYQAPGNPASYAANFVEVEVDTVTGMVKVLDFLAVHDIGKAINPGFVTGQIQGAVQMGIGMALSEDITFDNKGKVQNDRFGRYLVVNAPDMPDVRVLLIEEGEESGPYGAKSLGEVATVAAAPAIINAINNALDINIDVLPATPERIMEKLKEKGN
ncbi:MAG TPA: molybdopterin cofactor-binding domain-containing protein [Clostridia bacterium]|nr:molybdopterin cofactor-binding domain-containing protein [Clostridia bacterium]